MAKAKIWVATAHRWGDREGHHYLCGVFNKKYQAIKCADSEAEYRGGKYAVIVEEITVDSYRPVGQDYSREIYRAKSIRD